MQWIIDLLIDKLKNNKQKEWEPEPLWIEDDLPINHQEKEEEDSKDKDRKVIIIDL